MAHLTRRAYAVFFTLIAISLGGCSDGVSNLFVPDDSEPADNSGPGVAMPAAVGQVYDRVSSSGEPSSERFDIAEDGAFRLQFSSPSFFEYLGTYSLVGAEIDFDFDDSNTAGAWAATGTFNGDCLTVEYNVVMSLAGFEDGEYCRSPGT